MKSSIFVSITICLFVTFLTVNGYRFPAVFAQATEIGIDLAIYPAFINVTTDPGVPVSSQFRISNKSNSREYLKISLAKFKANESGEKPILQFVTDKDEFAKWISFSESQFILEPSEQKTIKFTIVPPADAALGYYYAVIIEEVKEKTPGQIETFTSDTPAFLIVLEVRSPNDKKELELISFKTSSSWYEYLPTTFSIKLKNSGNIHLVPAGDIFIDWGADQKDIGIVPINANKGNILPGTVRTYNTSWNDAFITQGEPMLITQEQALLNETKIDWSKITKFRIGKYTAHMLAVYDNGQRDVPLEATVSFWIIPWKIILAALVVLFITIFGAKFAVRRVFLKN